MKKIKFLSVLCLIFVVSTFKTYSQKMDKIPTAPVATIKPHTLEKFNDVRIDNYYWLNDPKNPEVIAYLNQENAYYDVMTANTKDFQKELFKEMKSRIKEDDQSVPYLYNGYFYLTRFETGQDYPIHTRKKGSLEANEEIMFNCNEMAMGQSYFNLGGVSVSPDNQFATFAVDKVSRRIYDIQIKNLSTGEILPDIIKNTSGSSVWANDNKTIFYTKKDNITLRSDKVYRHTIGTNPLNDELIFEEKDDTFDVFVYKEKSKKYIVIGSSSTLTNEFQILNADTPKEKFKIFQPRVRGLEYSISHFGNDFYILTNKDKATNFKLMKTPETATLKNNWVDVIPHREDVLIEDTEIFKDYLVVEERSNGLTQLRIMPWSGEGEYYLPFKSETYAAYTSTNVDFDTDILRYGYQSLGTPPSIIDFNMKTKTKDVKKEFGPPHKTELKFQFQ